MKFTDKPFLNDYGEIVVGYNDKEHSYYHAIIERNVRITKITLDRKDFGSLTSWIAFEWEGGGQGGGGYNLGGPFCYLWIVGILEALQLDDFYLIKGTNCRIRHSHDKVFQIGHINKDKWFDPSDMMEQAKILSNKFITDAAHDTYATDDSDLPF